MNAGAPIFFCAVGGSGMLPLALIMKARGYDIRGSDRSRDQKRTPERFAFIEKQGIELFPQDGSGITEDVCKMVISTAVEETVPDYRAAMSLNIPIVSRAQMLAEIFNQAETSIGVAGTSGKSTTTGMIGWILHKTGKNPTIMNGAVMKNFITPEIPFASAVIGDADMFVSEVDESDGSIAFFAPKVAVLNNIALDHKSMDELRKLFGNFIAKAGRAIINLDNEETAALAANTRADKLISYSQTKASATLLATNMKFNAQESEFDIVCEGKATPVHVKLNVPGHHNVSNALATIGAAMAIGIKVEETAAALSSFNGLRRRLEVVGTTSKGITVIDDFAHNPDKICASLRTLHQMDGRLLILFQPQGYSPLKLMRDEFADCFVKGLYRDDRLFMSDPVYLGGTTDKSVTSADIVGDVAGKGRKAAYMPKREDCIDAIVKEAKPGDKLVVMGARDDTLSALAADLLSRVG